MSTRRVFHGTSPGADLLSVQNGVSVCAGFEVGKSDLSRDAKSRCRPNGPQTLSCIEKVQPQLLL
jgi:hypothetical protein